MSTVFTPVGILEILSQISELDDYELGLQEDPNGDVRIFVGESQYIIKSSSLDKLVVPENVSDSIENIDKDTADEILDAGAEERSHSDVVESGVLREIVKSMLVGGAIRMIKKLL